MAKRKGNSDEAFTSRRFLVPDHNGYQSARPGVFQVVPRWSNHGDRHIGYRVISGSKTGGPREHGSFAKGGLEAAKREAEALAAKLQAEADANRRRTEG
jgi:hypothetical protein